MVVEDRQELCDKFGDYFTNIGTKIQAETRNSQALVGSNSCADGRGEGTEMEFRPCDSYELTKIVSSIGSNSAGLDGVNLKTIRSILVYILPVLVHLINLSMEKGVFPKLLKTAKILPLYKGGTQMDISNWRPISILPVFSKVYEKVIHGRLYDHLTSLHALYDGQFGFRKGHSTSHAVQHLLENINLALEKGEYCISIFIDFKKAFDTVDFSILLDRLRDLGVKGRCLDWFSSYLNGRSVRVNLGEKFSKFFPVSCGVPQGSVLGPLLYLVYVDSMRFYIPGASMTSFADDTALVVAAKTLEELVQKANRALQGLSDFVGISLLSINAAKSNYILFSRTGVSPNLPSEIAINGDVLKRVEEVRYLGFILDQNLSWRRHGDVVACKVARGLGILRRFQHFLPSHILVLLYHSLIAPYINYGCMIWASNFTCNFKRVQIQQNKAVRLIGKYDTGVLSTESIFRKLRILNVGQIRDFQIGIFVFQSLNGLAPDVFSNFFRFNSFYHGYATRNAGDLVSEPRSTVRSSHVARHSGPVVWNTFPDSIREAESVPQFKNRLKKHLLAGSW